MGFQQGLSGLNAASRGLDVIGHNIANANTNGMKASRAEFAELYAASLGSTGGVSAGIGVEIDAISQQFTQGNINITGNDLDVAINGAGFFQVSMPDGSTAYSRAGAFKLDRDGNIVTNDGAQLMGYPTTTDGTRLSFEPEALKLPTSAPIGARQTENITAEMNLDARAAVAATAVPPIPLTTYGTSLVAYDAQGVEIPVALYFTKTNPGAIAGNGTNTWDVFTSVNGSDPTLSTPFTLTFLSNGQIDPASITPAPTLTLISPNDPTFDPLNPGDASVATNPITVTLNLDNMTQYGTRFAVSDLSQDGYTAGELTGITIEDNGVITARYSNGESQAAGQVALVNFRNVQGLAPVGGYWIETFASGQPVRGSPGEGNFGQLRSGALEESNVDLTQELVNMMTAQRTYQANAQTIKTQDQILSTIVNLR